jgi:hypothetical protein
MKRFFKLLFSFFTSRRALLALIAVQQKQILLSENKVNYVTLPIPDKKQINSRLNDLFHDKIFSFYLMAMENDLFSLFRDGKGEDIYRGGMRAIDRIKQDMARAAADAHKEAKRNGQV